MGFHRALQPVLHAIDRDYDLIEVPLIVRALPIPTNAGGKMRAEPVDPKADGFAVDDDIGMPQDLHTSPNPTTWQCHFMLYGFGWHKVLQSNVGSPHFGPARLVA